MNRCICGFREISCNCSINQFLEYCDLTKVIAERLMTNFTFVLQTTSKPKFVIIFCSTEVLFSRDSESNQTHIFLEQAIQSLQKISFINVQENILRKANVVAPDLRNVSGRKCCGLRMPRLFSVALLDRFCCANEATQPEANKQKR